MGSLLKPILILLNSITNGPFKLSETEIGHTFKKVQHPGNNRWFVLEDQVPNKKGIKETYLIGEDCDIHFHDLKFNQTYLCKKNESKKLILVPLAEQ